MNESLLHEQGAAPSRATEPAGIAERDGTTGVAVDALLARLLEGREPRGREVRWLPTRLRVSAEADRLAVVLDALLSRVVASSETTPVVVRVASHGGFVRFTLSGAGNGTTRRPTPWWSRGPHRHVDDAELGRVTSLVHGLGGDLAVDRRAGSSASYTLSVPAASGSVSVA